MKDPVLVTTEFRGVFFGDLEKYDAKTKVATLKDARNCVSWSSDVHGVFGLATKGPSSNCKIGPKIKRIRYLEKVTAIVEVTKEAIKAWESEPWN